MLYTSQISLSLCDAQKCIQVWTEETPAMSVFVKPGPHTSKHYIPITLPYYIPMVLFPQVPFTIDFTLIRNYQQKDFIKEAQFKSHILLTLFPSLNQAAVKTGNSHTQPVVIRVCTKRKKQTHNLTPLNI